MSRKKTEINPIRAERIKELCKKEKITQTELAEKIYMTQQNLSRIMTLKNAVTEQTVDAICNVFPKWRKAYLMGYDDFATNADLFLNTIDNINKEGALLHTGLLSFAQVNGYQVEMAPLFGNDNLEKTFQNMKEYCTISRDGQSVTLSLAQLNDFENELCEYVDLRLRHMIG